MERDANDPNNLPLRANRARLAQLRLADGGVPEILELPMPLPLSHRGRRLPASYINFYVANETVLVPAFGCRQDDVALEVLGACFPGRRIVPIDCRRIVIGLGALHCLTQQVPLTA